MKNVNSSSVDMISELPSIILEIILMCLPTQDAARTSILSRKWRYRWAKLPQLVFDNTVTFKSLTRHIDIMIKIYESLLLHQGPILKFTLDIYNIGSCSEIDRMILFLSRNGIQDLTLWVWGEEHHKLPSYIFSCLQLRHLFLYHCEFKAPPNFEGFRKLISLQLLYVDLDPVVSITSFPLLETLKLTTSTTIDCFSVDAPYLNFLHFSGNIKHISLLYAPLLLVLRLSVYNGTYSGESSFDLIKVFGCLPLIENLHMHYKYLKLLAVPYLPKKLPSVLNNLRNLELSAIITEMDDVSSTLCLIRSCPNLRKINFFKVVNRPNTDVEPVLEYLEMQDYSEVSLNKLLEVEMKFFLGLRPELEFIKFLLAISPKLETVYIRPASEEIIKSGYKMLIELARFPRASPKAEIIFLESLW